MRRGGKEMDDQKLTMTVSEAAAALKISRGLAYEAARDGRLPCIRIGRRLLVSRRALEKLLEEPQPLNLTPAGK
jgi:excisionase family DNA binding protein